LDKFSNDILCFKRLEHSRVHHFVFFGTWSCFKIKWLSQVNVIEDIHVIKLRGSNSKFENFFSNNFHWHLRSNKFFVFILRASMNKISKNWIFHEVKLYCFWYINQIVISVLTRITIVHPTRALMFKMQTWWIWYLSWFLNLISYIAIYNCASFFSPPTLFDRCQKGERYVWWESKVRWN
jgi:hypothetical protein